MVRFMVRPMLRRRSREWKGGWPTTADDGRLLETCTWEMMRAESGTWDASVGLSELMRDSIFSASLLQASICKEKELSTEAPAPSTGPGSHRGSLLSSVPTVLARATANDGLNLLHTCKTLMQIRNSNATALDSWPF